MPAYNEAATVERALAAVLATPQEKEVILVDDGSTDGTREIITRLGEKHKDVRVIFHNHNQGKGAAVRTALAAAGGDVVLIQDCDLEYDPNEYGKLLEPITNGDAEVVYGTRAFTSHTRIQLLVRHWQQARHPGDQHPLQLLHL
jgi:glycosyltransferase involved in cell wall biosynthesis